MKPIKIFTDSCSDIGADLRKRRDIVSINFTIFMEGKEICADPWKDISIKELYEALMDGVHVYSLPATESEITAKFKAYAEKYDILYIAACEKQSTTITKARRIAGEMMEMNPDIRIEIVDSLNASVGEGMLVVKACDLRDEGKNIDEITREITALRKHIVQFATVDTLTYLSRANKINARSAIFGDFLDIKPILISDVEGKQISMSRVRGRTKSLEEIIRLFIENIEDPHEEEVIIIHGYDLITAQRVEKELINRGFDSQKIRIFCVGPVVGVTVGPSMIGLFGYGKEVTFLG